MMRAIGMVLQAMALLVACTSLAGPAQAQPFVLAPLPAAAPVVACASLAQVDLAAVTGAATTLVAKEVSGQQPYCAVTGTIAPAIRFEVRLPLKGWTQRFLQTGCGGLCGSLRIEANKASGCAPVTDGSIVLASTDMGHQGMDTGWGDDPQKRIDFAHRSVHVTALAAKALIKAFYGQGPRFAYFSGCSDGGREALIEAQRYPDDFDGIAAGAPALNFSVQNSFHHGWLAKANTGPDGTPLLTAIDMPLLHNAVLAQCDALDGLVDGQITDPRACHVDPGTLLCKGHPVAGQCLSAAQIAAVRAIYAGATGPNDERLEVGPLQPGSEMEWIGVFVPVSAKAPLMSAIFAGDTINHLLFTPNPQPPYTVANFPFDAAMHARQDAARALYNAEDADLARFAGHGGKLILWHGWADPHISPINTIDYFARVGRTMSEAARDKAVRLFLFPGMGHCDGGSGPNDFGLLGALMAWVESDSAPQVLIAKRAALHKHDRRGAPEGPPQDEPKGLPPMMMGPPRLQLPPRSRPVYAYPAVARYTGSGSIDDAANFVAATPARLDDIADWIGARK
ncbi:tannase/feruloyl esterase family alpha/beta hydrolase [Novosphingobium sp. FKTRR1]|uniref:tannase/feruloyl esterase family alpha/beta hydrolase n=1 Tax=Novosphingobium sp. FKTRR1 TaxID=2879118 RepID=UPI001CF0517B|nr:tannase/feruloyl esterase family alpha/beta hydrolase [Novosphingobium sp. FKTRR1]